MPIASTNPTLNAVVHAEGKPFRLADYFSILLNGTGIRQLRVPRNISRAGAGFSLNWVE